jgi:hypothetical protein
MFPAISVALRVDEGRIDHSIAADALLELAIADGVGLAHAENRRRPRAGFAHR